MVLLEALVRAHRLLRSSGVGGRGVPVVEAKGTGRVVALDRVRIPAGRALRHPVAVLARPLADTLLLVHVDGLVHCAVAGRQLDRAVEAHNVPVGLSFDVLALPARERALLRLVGWCPRGEDCNVLGPRGLVRARQARHRVLQLVLVEAGGAVPHTRLAPSGVPERCTRGQDGVGG